MEKKQLFEKKLIVVNIGVQHFAESLRAQKVETAQVSWRPPLNKKLNDLLGKVL